MCLGSDAVIAVTPKSGFPSPAEPSNGASVTGPSSSMLVDDEDVVMIDDVLPAQDETGDDPPPEGDVADANLNTAIAPGAPASGRYTPKPPKPAIVTTLVHGDVLLLSGDDFEVTCHAF
jgi:hypothetical protein